MFLSMTFWFKIVLAGSSELGFQFEIVLLGYIAPNMRVSGSAVVLLMVAAFVLSIMV